MTGDTQSSSVTAIVPTRNRPAMLGNCLRAIAHQVQKTSVVVIDDGSTAVNSSLNQQLAREFSASYHYLDSAGGKGAGPSFARNVGISLAKDPFVAFCDDDDYWIDDDHLRQCVTLFDQDPELDFIFANQEAHHNGKVAIRKQTAQLPENLGLDSTSSGGKSFLLSKEDCLLGWFPHLNTSVFRRELLEKINGFWGIECYEDLDLYVRAVDAARHIRYLDRTVAIQDNPIHSGRESITARLREKDIKVCAINVATHIIHTVGSKAAIRYAGRFAGEAYRWLALDANQAADRQRAAAYARLALAAKFSPKWSLVTAFFTLRRWI